MNFKNLENYYISEQQAVDYFLNKSGSLDCGKGLNMVKSVAVNNNLERFVDECFGIVFYPVCLLQYLDNYFKVCEK